MHVYLFIIESYTKYRNTYRVHAHIHKETSMEPKKVKVKKCIAVCRQTCHHHYGNSHAIWDHTVLPATRQR